eukprot:GDKI01016670.1.p1 GENE.GDKI01016670.1~~GDKI01016670.1.p1  ORF type:complete len:454 (+),score=135.11 GDKI01016670.1:408-1769(+)
MASFLHISPAHPTDTSNALLHNKHAQQQQQQHNKRQQGARTHTSDLLAFVQPSNTGNAEGERVQQPFSKQHTNPPRVPLFGGSPCLSSTTASCKAPAYEVGNAIVSGLEGTRRTHGNACATTCNPDTYTMHARAFIDFRQVEACIRLYSGGFGGDVVVCEVAKVSGDCLAFSNFWREITSCLRARGLLGGEEGMGMGGDTQETCACSTDNLIDQRKLPGEIFDMDAFEDELLEEMETDVPSDVSSESGGGDRDMGDMETETQERPHPFFELAVSCDLRELEEAAQMAARLARNSHSSKIFTSPQGVSALASIIEHARAQNVVGMCGVLSIIYPVLCAFSQLAADHPRVCVDAQLPLKLTCLLKEWVASATAVNLSVPFGSDRFFSMSPRNGVETVTREALRCLLTMCVSSHVSSIAAGGLRETLGSMRDAVSAFGDTETRTLFDRLLGELNRK